MANTLDEIVTYMFYQMGEKTDNITYDQQAYAIPTINILIRKICEGTVINVPEQAKWSNPKPYKAWDLSFLRQKLPIIQVWNKPMTAELLPTDTTLEIDATNFSDCVDISQDLQDSVAICWQTINVWFIQQQGQTFRAFDNIIKKVSLYKKPDTWAFTWDVTINIEELDTNLLPNGVVLGTKTILNADRLTLTVNAEFTFDIDAIVQNGKRYAITVSTSTADDTNYINLWAQSTNVYADGNNVAKENGVWTKKTSDLYFKVHSYRYVIVQGCVIKYTGKTSTQLTWIENNTFVIKSGKIVRQLYKMPANAFKMFRLFFHRDNNDYEYEVNYQDFRYDAMAKEYFTIITDWNDDVSLIDIIGVNKQDNLFYLYYYLSPQDLTYPDDVCVLPKELGKSVISTLAAATLLYNTEEIRKATELFWLWYAALLEMYGNYAELTEQPRKTVKRKKIWFSSLTPYDARVIQGPNCR